MKKIYYMSILLMCQLTIGQSAHSQQNSSGIYKTAEDFQQKTLSFSIDCNLEKHKIRTNILFDGSEVRVKHMGTTYTMKKSETFGYRACGGKVYRFVDNKEYTILNPIETLNIYYYQNPAHSPKEAAKYHPMYFFSKDAKSELQELTKANLKAAFPGNHKFHDALDVNFKEDKEISAYDSFHKMYKLNWILKNNGN